MNLNHLDATVLLCFLRDPRVVLIADEHYAHAQFEQLLQSTIEASGKPQPTMEAMMITKAEPTPTPAPEPAPAPTPALVKPPARRWETRPYHGPDGDLQLVFKDPDGHHWLVQAKGNNVILVKMPDLPAMEEGNDGTA